MQKITKHINIFFSGDTDSTVAGDVLSKLHDHVVVHVLVVVHVRVHTRTKSNLAYVSSAWCLEKPRRSRLLAVLRCGKVTCKWWHLQQRESHGHCSHNSLVVKVTVNIYIFLSSSSVHKVSIDTDNTNLLTPNLSYLYSYFGRNIHRYSSHCCSEKKYLLTASSATGDTANFATEDQKAGTD